MITEADVVGMIHRLNAAAESHDGTPTRALTSRFLLRQAANLLADLAADKLEAQ